MIALEDVTKHYPTRDGQVTVLDAADAPAAGASALPAGLFCPHVSPDDSLLSRLSRDGARLTLAQLQMLSGQGLLQPGQSCGMTGPNDPVRHGHHQQDQQQREDFDPGGATRGIHSQIGDVVD